MVYVTRGLVEILLELGAEADPRSVSTGVSVTAAGEIDGVDGLPPETPVFTDFYLPHVGESVNAVFGVDLSTPPAQTQGQFVSHPMGELEVLRGDDLAQVLFVAVPPWTEDAIGAFDRRGRRQELEILDVEFPQESFAGTGT